MISLSISIWAMFQQFVIGSPFGNNPASNYLLIILVAITGIGFPMSIYITGLDTEVRHCGLYIRFKPFHRKWMIFEFENIRKVKPVIYKPLMNYGGFGIRYGKKGKTYNVSGHKEVFLTLKNGKTILIGSNNHEDNAQKLLKNWHLHQWLTSRKPNCNLMPGFYSIFT